MKILIVDDAAFCQFMLTAIIKKLKLDGCKIETASNGLEAVKKMKTFEADLVLMDIFMPELDGISATRVIKTLYPKTEIIIVSCSSCKENVVCAFEAGAVNYIVKPFQEEKLQRAINGFNKKIVDEVSNGTTLN